MKFTVLCYNEQSRIVYSDDYACLTKEYPVDKIEVVVNAESETGAISAAKKITKREEYTIIRVEE